MINDMELRNKLHGEIGEAGSQAAFAEKQGLIRQHVSSALRGDRFRTSVATALGYKAVRMWVPIK